jgi:hypothetical protein
MSARACASNPNPWFATWPEWRFRPRRRPCSTKAALWRRYHATSFPRKIRDELKLNRPFAGWYQIRKALEQFGDTELTDFEPFKAAYATLGTKLRPIVFELWFIPA